MGVSGLHNENDCYMYHVNMYMCINDAPTMVQRQALWDWPDPPLGIDEYTYSSLSNLPGIYF